jgi:hypothetical protein
VGGIIDEETVEMGGTTSSLVIAPKVTGVQPDGGFVKYIQIFDPVRQKPAWPAGNTLFLHVIVLSTLISHMVEMGCFVAEGKNLNGSRLAVEMKRPSSVVKSPLVVNEKVRASCGLVLIVPPEDEIYCRSARLVRPCATYIRTGVGDDAAELLGLVRSVLSDI